MNVSLTVYSKPPPPTTQHTKMTLRAAAPVQLAAGGIAANQQGFPIFGILFGVHKSAWMLCCGKANHSGFCKISPMAVRELESIRLVVDIGIVQVWGVFTAGEHQVWLQDIIL